ncbi:MAG: methyltransferase domain-containing protein [Candidatus Krumholzibacteriota bacterium]
MDRYNIKDFLTELQSAPGWAAANVLDIRTSQSFTEGHLAGSSSHPLEDVKPPREAEYLERELPSIFLPPRHEPLVVIAARQERADRLARHLAGRDRAEVTGLALPPAAVDQLPADLKETGSSSRCLWKAPLWLRRHADLLPPPAAGPVLDLACGSGRAAVWLAQKGYRVTGIDWQVEALDLGRRLAADRGVTCNFLAGDLRDPQALPEGPWAVILNFRFRQPDLLEKIPGLLQKGGVALIRTFRAAPGYEGHPSPRYRLRPHELPRYFPAGQCEILAHEESHDPDGRPAAGIVARKK